MLDQTALETKGNIYHKGVQHTQGNLQPQAPYL